MKNFSFDIVIDLRQQSNIFMNSPYNGSIDVTDTDKFHAGYLDLISLQSILSFSPWTIRVQHICFDLVQLAFLVWSSALARLSPMSLASDRRPIQSPNKEAKGEVWDARAVISPSHRFPDQHSSSEQNWEKNSDGQKLSFEGYLRHRKICEQFHPWLLRDDRNQTC